VLLPNISDLGIFRGDTVPSSGSHTPNLTREKPAKDMV
jgi:hypothetical protein